MLGRIRDHNRARAHPHRNPLERRLDDELRAPDDAVARPRLDPLAPRQRDLALAGAVVEHRRDPQRRAEAVGVADRPAASVGGIDQAQRADDRQTCAGRGGGGRADVRDQLLVRQHVFAVEVEHSLVIAPGLLGNPRVGVHQRREAAELQPPQQQLRSGSARRAGIRGSRRRRATSSRCRCRRPTAWRRQARAATRSPRPGPRPRSGRWPAARPSRCARTGRRCRDGPRRAPAAS